MAEISPPSSDARPAGFQSKPPGRGQRQRAAGKRRPYGTRVHTPQSQAPGSSTGLRAEAGHLPAAALGRTAICASLGKFSAKLGMGVQQRRIPGLGAPIPFAGTGTRNGLHPGEGPGARAGGRSDHSRGGGEPLRGQERTRFPNLRPSVTSQGTTLGGAGGPQLPEPHSHPTRVRGRQPPPQEEPGKSQRTRPPGECGAR